MNNINGQDEQVSSAVWKMAYPMGTEASDAPVEGAPLPEDIDPELEEAARDEREYVRERLRQELGREPTPEEQDEWLRQHTEGY
jgi:hypothetical protein